MQIVIFFQAPKMSRASIEELLMTKNNKRQCYFRCPFNFIKLVKIIDLWMNFVFQRIEEFCLFFFWMGTIIAKHIPAEGGFGLLWMLLLL